MEGDQFEAEVELEYPIKRTRRFSLWLNGGFEFRNSDTELLGGESVLSEDRLRVAKIGARFLQRDRLGYTEGSIEVRQGLDVLDASDDKAAPRSRFDGEVNFTTVRLEIARDVVITRRFSVYGAAAGQLSRGPLLSSEEFAIGGTTFGRGYDPSERTGDHGVGVTGEVRFSGDFKLFKRPAGYQLYGFADYGHIWNADRGLPDQDSLASAGGGLRLNLPKDIYLQGEVAVPFQKLRRTNDADPRFLFNIVKRF